MIDFTQVVTTEAKESKFKEDRINQLDRACRTTLDQLHWTSAPVIFENAKQVGKPISKKYKDWADACWNHFEAQATLLQAGTPWNDSMLNFPTKPVESVLLARKE